MPIFLSRLRGTFEERLWQIGSVVSAARRGAAQFSIVNGIPPLVHNLMSCGVRNLAPFAEASWPLIALPVVNHSNGIPIAQTITELDESVDVGKFGKDDAILFDGKFKRIENIDRDYFREILWREPPFTVAPVSDELQATLGKCKFVHFDGSPAAATMIRSTIEAETQAESVLVVSPLRALQAEKILGPCKLPLFYASDSDRPMALMLMARTKGSLLKPPLSDLAFWADFMASSP